MDRLTELLAGKMPELEDDIHGTVLMSIHPDYARQIWQGSKHYEYRTRLIPADVRRVIVYETSPMRAITGWFTCAGVMSAAPDLLWGITCRKSGISETSYRNYFRGRDRAYAIMIDSPVQFEVPVFPYQELKSFRAPQSWVWLNTLISRELQKEETVL